MSDKIVMVFDGEPTDADGVSLITKSQDKSKWSTDWSTKSKIAKKNGAKMLLVVANDLKTMINMTFEHEVTANFTLTTRSTTENAFWIYGRKGRIRVDDLFSESQGLSYEVDGQNFKESYPFEINGFEYQVRDVVDCIAKGVIEHPNVTHKNTLEVMTIADHLRHQIGLYY